MFGRGDEAYVDRQNEGFSYVTITDETTEQIYRLSVYVTTLKDAFILSDLSRLTATSPIWRTMTKQAMQQRQRLRRTLNGHR